MKLSNACLGIFVCIISCNKSADPPAPDKPVQMVVEEYKTGIRISGARVVYGTRNGTSDIVELSSDTSDVNGVCEIPKTAFEKHDTMYVIKEGYFSFTTRHSDATKFSLSTVSHVTIKVVDTTVFPAGSGRSLYIEGERIDTDPIFLMWEVPTSKNLVITARAFGGEINKIRVRVFHGTDTLMNKAMEVSIGGRSDTTNVEFKY